MVYNAGTVATITGTPTINGLVGSDTTNSVSLSGTVTGSFTSANVGNGIAVTPSFSGTTLVGTAAGNYYIDTGSTTGGTTTALSGNITPAPITITATKTYDGSNTVATANLTATGVNGQTLDLSAGTATLSNPNVGTASLVSLNGATLANGTGSNAGLASNYTISNPVLSTVTINPEAITVSATNAVMTYNGSTSIASATTLPSATLVSGTLYTNASTGVADTLSGGTFAFASPNAGSNVTLNVSGVGVVNGSTNASSNYTITYLANSTSTITPALLTYSVSSATGNYGSAASLANANAVLTGFVNSTDAANVTPVIAAYSGATAVSLAANTPVGNYAIQVSGLLGSASGNYQIANTGNSPGALTITPAPLTITIGNQATTYGIALTLGTTGFTTSALVNGDSVSAVNLVVAGNAVVAGTTNAGTYSITSGGISGVGLSNYTITYVPGAFTVSPKAITVTANNASMTYGDSALPNLSAQSTGLVNGDSLTGALSTTATAYNGIAGSASSVGSYAITQGSLSAGPNYSVTFVPATLTVNPAVLTIAANSQSTTYGTPIVLSQTAFTASGLVNGDYVSSATIQYGGSQVVAGTTNAGTYSGAITIANAVGTGLGNYTISYQNGGLQVNKAALTITANSSANFVGLADPVGYAGVTYSGLQNADTASSVLGGATVSITRTNSSVTSAGTYSGVLVPSLSVSSLQNYTITYVAGNYTIVPAGQLLVQAGTNTTTYGTTVSYTASGLTAAYCTNCAVGMTGSPNIVDISPSIAVTGNNAIVINDGNGTTAAFSIATQNPLYSASGNVNVGNYNLGASGTSITSTGSTPNFSGVTVVGTLAVTPMQINLANVNIAGVTKVYDGSSSMTNLAVSAAGSGVITGDAVSLQASGSFATQNVGTGLSYTVNVGLSGADASNYQIVGGTSGGSIYSGNNGAITQLASVTYTGPVGGNWSNPSNWTTTGTSATGAVPTLSNVANVILPSGSSVVYDSAVAGPVTSAVTDNGSLTISETTSTTIGMPISGSGSLTIANTGPITLSGNNSYSGGTTINAGASLIAGSANALGNGVVQSNGTTTSPAIFAAASGVTLSQLAISGGVTELASDISTSGSQTYNTNLVIAASTTDSTTLNSANAPITITGTLDGASNKTESLVIDAGTSTVTLGNSIGSIARLNNLTIDGSRINILADILTGVAQTYNGAVYIGDASYIGETPTVGFLFTSQYTGYFQYIAANGVSSSTLQYLNTDPIYVRSLISEDPSITFNGTVNDITPDTHTLLVAAIVPANISQSAGVNAINGAGSISFNAPVGATAPLYSLNTQVVVNSNPSNGSISNASNYVGSINVVGSVTTYEGQTYRANMMSAQASTQPGVVTFAVWDPNASINYILPVQNSSNSTCAGSNCGQINLQNPNSVDALVINGGNNFIANANNIGDNNWGTQISQENALGYVAPRAPVTLTALIAQPIPMEALQSNLLAATPRINATVGGGSVEVSLADGTNTTSTSPENAAIANPAVPVTNASDTGKLITVQLQTSQGYTNITHSSDQSSVGFVFVVPPEVLDLHLTSAQVDPSKPLTYVAVMEDGSPLPAWLAFDSDGKTFSSARVPDDVKALTIRLQALQDGKVVAKAIVTIHAATQ